LATADQTSKDNPCFSAEFKLVPGIGVQNLESRLKLPNINLYILDEFILVLVNYINQIKELAALYGPLLRKSSSKVSGNKNNYLIKKFVIENFKISLVFNDLEKISEQLEAARKFRLLFSFLEKVKFVFFNLQRFSQNVI